MKAYIVPIQVKKGGRDGFDTRLGSESRPTDVSRGLIRRTTMKTGEF